MLIDMREKTMEEMRKIEMDIYSEMFNKATPPANFKKLMDDLCNLEPNWYNRYYLSELTQRRIIDLACSKHKCSESERRRIGCDIRMGFAPSTNKHLQHNPYMKPLGKDNPPRKYRQRIKAKQDITKISEKPKKRFLGLW